MITCEEVFPQLIRRRAQEVPDHIYVQRVEGGELTYGEFYWQSLLWADALERHGVEAECQVAFMVPNGFDAALGLVGCGWLRARFTAINTAYRGNLLTHVLNNACPKVWILAKRYLAQLEGQDLERSSVESIIVIDDDDPASIPGVTVMGRTTFFSQAEMTERDGPNPWDVASIIYTSGTTGPSKGVVVYWAQLHATAADATCEAMDSSDCWFSPLPVFHVAGQSSLYKTALYGGRIVLREILSIEHFFADIERYSVTGTVLLESMIGLIMKKVEAGFVKPPSLRYFILVPVPDGIDAFKQALGVRIATMYNMTEISGPLSSGGFQVDDSFAGSCGRVRPGYEVRVVDEHDLPLGPGEVGELVVRSEEPWILNGGYLNNPEATLQAWRNGWFHTGDAFRYDERGFFYFVDRMKDTVRRRGENISSMEVEQEINAHPDVEMSAVVAAFSEQGDEEVKAFIVLGEGKCPGPVEIIEFIKPRLPHFMIPRYLEFIDELPRTPSQKVQKHLLREKGNTSKTWDREQYGIVIKRG